VVKGDEHRTVEAITWGFPHFRGSGVIINARAETAHEKPMFRKNLALRRCLIPSTGFYEWAGENKKSKQKYLFKLPDDPVLYMAGLFNDFDGVRRFVILTTQANQSVVDIHDRMPLVLLRAELNGWLRDPHLARDILNDQRNRPQLIRQVVG
jgi:putative SOS response-associated peptidase YedK